MYRFDAVQQLQQHLLRCDLYGDLKTECQPDHRWDQTIPPPSSHMREVTDGSWHVRLYRASSDGHQVCSPPILTKISLNDELQYSSFVISVEEYQDATGTDNKEF
jgi:hypothetical protein